MDETKPIEGVKEEEGLVLPMLSPKQTRITVIILFIILVWLVVFLGFAFGAALVCNQVNGALDASFKCHLDYNQTKQIQPNFEFVPINFSVR